MVHSAGTSQGKIPNIFDQVPSLWQVIGMNDFIVEIQTLFPGKGCFHTQKLPGIGTDKIKLLRAQAND